MPVTTTVRIIAVTLSDSTIRSNNMIKRAGMRAGSFCDAVRQL